MKSRTKALGCIIFIVCVALAGLGMVLVSLPKAIDEINEAVNEIGTAVGEGIVNSLAEPFAALGTPATYYYTQRSRWPANIGELETSASKLGMELDLSKYEKLSFLSNPDGTLTISYTLKDSSGPGWVISGTTGTTQIFPPKRGTKPAGDDSVSEEAPIN